MKNGDLTSQNGDFVCVCSYMMFASKIEISVVKNANE
jgi:hypothetical protein